jgi:hypothetical protein
MQAPKENPCKYMYLTYGSREEFYSDLISDLKRIADQE